jgi:anti-anti-sigma regulatory factor
MSFQLELYRNGETLFIRVKGRVVLDECERFKQACMPLVKQGVKKVAVEMSEVEFIDSAGAWAFWWA